MWPAVDRVVLGQVFYWYCVIILSVLFVYLLTGRNLLGPLIISGSRDSVLPHPVIEMCVCVKLLTYES